MEAKNNKFISKILPIFINAGFGVEKFDDTTYGQALQPSLSYEYP